MSNNRLLKNIPKFSLSKIIIKYTQIIFIISFLISVINCQTEAEDRSKVKLVGNTGLGPGTLAVIIAIGFGVLICIFGLAFSSPGIFVFIGILLPLLVFIICAFLPAGKEEEKDDSVNTHKDVYMVARWIHFLIMLLLFIGLIFPFFLKANITVIPQRVNSTTMKDSYDDKYLEDLEKQKKRRYNLENNSVDDEEKLPLSSKKKKNAFIRIDKDSNKDINNNLFENNLDDENELPMAKVKTKDEFNENRSKFKKFKRIQNSNQ